MSKKDSHSKDSETKVTTEAPVAEEKAEKQPQEAEAEAAKSEEAAPEVSELDELKTKCTALQEQYMRKAADFENYRKRMIREKQEAIDYANTNLLLDLLEILDGFDRAIDAVGTPETGSPLESFSQGVTMIREQMGGMLASKYGLEYVPAKGELFDPNIHEAVATLPSKEVKDPTVGEEMQKGYRLRQRMIRHAKVMVLMPETEASDANEENK